MEFRSDRTDDRPGVAARLGSTRTLEIGLALLIAVCVMIPLARHAASGPRAGSVHAITRSGFAACLSERMLDSARRVASDTAAYRRLAADPATGCMLLRGGRRVVVEESDAEKRLIAVPGRAEPLWTDSAAVEVNGPAD